MKNMKHEASCIVNAKNSNMIMANKSSRTLNNHASRKHKKYLTINNFTLSYPNHSPSEPFTAPEANKYKMSMKLIQKINDNTKNSNL